MAKFAKPPLVPARRQKSYSSEIFDSNSQSTYQIIATDLVMPCNISKYAGKRTYFDRIVGRNGNMVFTFYVSGNTNVTSCLPRYFVTKLS